MWLFNKHTKEKTKALKSMIIDNKKPRTKSRVLSKTKEIELSNIAMCIEDVD